VLGLDLPEEAISDVRAAVKERIRTRPENVEFQRQIDELGRRKDRLRDLYVMGDVPRDEYTVLRTDLERQIAHLERQLGGAGYPLETVLARIGQLGGVVARRDSGAAEESAGAGVQAGAGGVGWENQSGRAARVGPTTVLGSGSHGWLPGMPPREFESLSQP
jgi:hypothetical protein